MKLKTLGVALVILSLGALSDDARAGGRSRTLPATLIVSPNPVVASTETTINYYTITGSGFTPGQNVYIMSTSAGSWFQTANAEGKITFTRRAGTTLFPVKVDAYQTAGRKTVLMATLTYQVVQN